MLDISTRIKELAKIRKFRKSREALTADFKQNPHRWTKLGRELDVNLDLIFQLASPGKDQALGHVLEDLGVQMVDQPHFPSSKLGDLGGVNTAADIAASAFLQRLYTIGNRFPRHPLVAAFTLAPITSGSVFNPYAYTPLREEEEIAPEDLCAFLA